jgi:hypothetical protein
MTAPSPQPPPVPPPPDPMATVNRPGRALIGWMPPDEAHLWLTSRRKDLTPSPDQVAWAQQAGAAVAARSPGLDQSGIVQDAPSELDIHIKALQADQATAALFAAGWRVAIVDLGLVCAAQPVVHVDHADERVAPADPDDLASVAAISLPIATPQEFPVNFDPQQKAWILSSANPNLRITGAGIGNSDGGPVVGFMVTITTSLVKVARYRGRYILTDGYHRAHGFLRRGIRHVPALVGDVTSFEALGLPAGMLSQDTYLGDRPPKIADYLDDEVAADVEVPVTHKTLVITGLEVNTSG